jgi:tol-pal system protein YbgF
VIRTAIVLAVLATLPVPAAAQDRAESLADIRSEIAALGAEIAALRSEYVSTGTVARFGGTDALARMDAIEAALTLLTAQTEDLQFRIDRIVRDATNRLGDLEFRVTELEGGDIGALGPTREVGAEVAPTPPPETGPAPGAAPAPARGQAEFDRAREVLGQGDFRAAADLLAAYAAANPSDPLSGEALFLRGEALEALDDLTGAARAYLDSFSGYPDGMRAPDALFRLGLTLVTLGQRHEACLTLAEVGVRYPDSVVSAEASATRARLDCP